MKLWNHLYLIDAINIGIPSQHLWSCRVEDSMQKYWDEFVKFWNFHSQQSTLQNTVVVYAHNNENAKRHSNIEPLEHLVNTYNQKKPIDTHVKFEKVFNKKQIKQLYKDYPPRRTFITGGELNGCVTSADLPANYFFLKQCDPSAVIIPELGYITTHNIYDVWHFYQKSNIDMWTVELLHHYFIEQTIRTRGFNLTAHENNYTLNYKDFSITKSKEK